ncbi:MAG: hypothetical protein MRY83_21200 [Flavobacteriales bacterium]|nr:hypothetical protein [Flavobacteriales bacterium]
MKVFFSLSLVLCSLSLCGQVAVDKIERYIPSTQLTLDSVFEFVVTFDKDVLQVDTSDFSLSGTISAFTAIDQLVGSGDTYYVITSSSGAPTGTLGLDIKGVDGSGVNNIIEDNSQLDQQSLGDIQITDSKIFGQSFIPTISGDLVKVTVQTGIGHVYSGAGTMELIAGEGYGGAVLSTENINVSSALQEYTYTFTNPASISSGSVYTLRFNFPNAPAQSTAFSAQVGAGYSGGVLYQSSSFPSADLYFKTYVIPNGSLVTLSNTLPSVDETFTHVLCDVESVSNVLSGSDCQGLSGAATTAISGGTPNYSYLWSNGETNATASNLVYGLNTVTITDSLGCTATDTVFIENSCDIRVLGNSIEIFSNDITPSLLDSTDLEDTSLEVKSMLVS